MELFEFVFDYVLHIFDFIKNSFLRTFMQIVAMGILTIIIVAFIWGISQLIIWATSHK